MSFVTLLVAIAAAIGSLIRRGMLWVWDILMDPRMPIVGLKLATALLVGIPLGALLTFDAYRGYQFLVHELTVVKVQTQTITVHDPGKVIREYPSASPTGGKRAVPVEPLSVPRPMVTAPVRASATPSPTSSSSLSLPVPTVSPSATPVQMGSTPPSSAPVSASPSAMSSASPVTPAPSAAPTSSAEVPSKVDPSTSSSAPTGS